MKIFGHHSRYTSGSPENLRALQELNRLARSGDQNALATLRTIAGGGMTTGSEVPGINGDVDWGVDDAGRQHEREAAALLLRNDRRGYNAAAGESQQNAEEWDGGWLADVAPASLGIAGEFIGIPAPVTAGIVGGIESAAGITNRSPEEGVLLGLSEGAAVNALAPGIGGPNPFTSVPGARTPSLSSVAGSTGSGGTGSGAGGFNWRDLLSIGSKLYSDSQLGAQKDEEMRLLEEMNRAKIDQIYGGMQPRTPYNEWDAERNRRLGMGG